MPNTKASKSVTRRLFSQLLICDEGVIDSRYVGMSEEDAPVREYVLFFYDGDSECSVSLVRKGDDPDLGKFICYTSEIADQTVANELRALRLQAA